jgi:hypothetical protein
MHSSHVAFLELKMMLTNAPMLEDLMPKEPMLLYILATNQVANTFLVIERQEVLIHKVQSPI